MDWNAIVIGLISGSLSSGFAMSLMYFKENKKAKQLQNEKAAIDEWQEIAHERKNRCDELKASLDKKDDKIEGLYKENAQLRQRNDSLSSKNAALSILKCRDLACDHRKPPFGNKDPEEQTNN